MQALLDENPFTDHGYCYYNRLTGIIQEPPVSKETEIHNTILAKSVHELGLGAGSATRQLPIYQQPFEHLTHVAYDNKNAPWLKESSWYDLYPIINLRDKLDPTKLIDEEELNVIFSKIKIDMIKHYELRSKTFKIRDKNKTFNLRQTNKTFKLRDKIKTFNLRDKNKTFDFRDRNKTFNLRDRILTFNLLNKNKTFNLLKKNLTFKLDKTITLNSLKKFSVVNAKNKTFKLDKAETLNSLTVKSVEKVKLKNTKTQTKVTKVKPKAKRGRPTKAKTKPQPKVEEDSETKSSVNENPNTLSKIETNDQFKTKSIAPTDFLSEPTLKISKTDQTYPEPENKKSSESQQEAIGLENTELYDSYIFPDDDDELEAETTITDKPAIITNFITSDHFYPKLMAASNNSLLKVNNDQQLFFNCLTLVGTNKFQEIFNIKNVFKKSLYEFRDNCRRVGSLCNNFDYIRQYISYNIKYLDATTFKLAIDNFKFYPIQGPHHLINSFNTIFGETILNAWAVNALCKERKSSDYFGKALSGTTASARS